MIILLCSSCLLLPLCNTLMTGVGHDSPLLPYSDYNQWAIVLMLVAEKHPKVSLSSIAVIVNW